MIDMNNKEVSKCGWAGPLLWVCTNDGYAIHLYDAPIILNNNKIEIGTDINSQLNGNIIKRINTDKDNFIVTFNADITLKINSEEHETARVFKQKGTDPHCVYENGEFCCD